MPEVIDPSLLPGRVDARARRLVGIAFRTIADHYVPERHQIAAALLDANGSSYVGLHLEAMVGRASTCAEAVALSNATLRVSAPLVAVAAVRYPKPSENGVARIVPPCGLCRELLLDYAPSLEVVLDIGGSLHEVRLSEILPHKYVGTKWVVP